MVAENREPFPSAALTVAGEAPAARGFPFPGVAPRHGCGGAWGRQGADPAGPAPPTQRKQGCAGNAGYTRGSMSSVASGPDARAARATVTFLYTSGFVQGVIMVSFAASSAVLRGRHGFSDTQYGSIFLPQVALSAVGAIGSSALLRRLDLRRLLVLSFASMALSQAALAASHFLEPGPAFAAVLLGTSLMGLGAGLSAAPLNTYPQLLFPARSDSAVVAMHTAIGFGLAGGPLFVGAVVGYGAWLLFPLVFLAACLYLLGETLRVALPEGPPPRTPKERGPSPAGAPRFWLFVALAVLYAVAEAAYANWAVLYLSEEKGLPVASASLGLAAFWLALSAGRVLAGFFVLRFPGERVYLGLPVLMAAASLLLPRADGVASGVTLYALAGLGCSAFYPLTVSLASRRFPGHVAWVGAILYAALVTGIGLGSFAAGALRERWPLSTIYGWSALCPLLALVLALPAIARPEKAPGPEAAGP